MSGFDLQVERKSASLRLLVEEKIRGAIASYRLRPGQRLVEKDLCAQLGVGRTSIREALRQLEAEGLVVTIPHRGTMVVSINLGEAAQLYEVRAVLEGFAGRNFAERGSEAEVEALRTAMERFELAVEMQDGGELLAAKAAFYAALMAGGANVFVGQMLTILHNKIALLRVTSMNQPSRLAHTVAELREIHEAIAAKDGPRAETACRQHVAKAAEVALSVLEKTVMAAN